MKGSCHEKNLPPLRSCRGWYRSGSFVNSVESDPKFGSPIYGGWQAGASGRLSEMGLCLFGVWNELQPEPGRNANVHQFFRFAFRLRFVCGQWEVAGQNHVRTGSVWLDFARFDQQARKLSNRLVWLGRGSKG